MTLDEAIEHEEELAKINQRVVDTGIVFDDVTIDMLYCDDTEVIEEHLANYQRCAEEHKQISEWLKELKRLKEQEPTIDKIRAEIESIERYGTVNGHDIWLRTPEEIKKEVLRIIDKYKAESEDKE